MEPNATPSNSMPGISTAPAAAPAAAPAPAAPAPAMPAAQPAPTPKPMTTIASMKPEHTGLHVFEGALLGVVIGFILGAGAYMWYEKQTQPQTPVVKNPQEALLMAQQQLSQSIAQIEQFKSANAQLSAQLPKPVATSTGTSTKTH